MSTFYAEDFLNRRNSSSTTSMSDITKGTLTGAAIGVVGGGLYAYFQKAKFGRSIIIGALAGGLISRIFLIKK